MAESTLSITYAELRRAIGFDRGLGRDPSIWISKDVVDVDDVIRSGLRRFYNPPGGHVWSFLKPHLTVDTVAAQEDYDLPDDFGFMSGDLTYTDSTTIYAPVIQTGPQEIYKMRQQLDSVNERPVVYAVKPETSTGVTGQRFKLMLFPTPQSVYELRGRYFSHQAMISDDSPYPLGGAWHGETIKAACLAEAELKYQGELGARHTEFLNRLQASVEYDRRSGSEGSLGYNGDGPTPTRIFRSRAATYNGVIP